MENHLKYCQWENLNRDDFEISDSEELDILLSRTSKPEFLTIEKDYKRFEFRKPIMIVEQLKLF